MNPTSGGEWPRFRKTVLLLLAGMMVLFAVLTALGQSHKQLDFRGLSMTREDLPDRTVYTGESIGNNQKTVVSVTCIPEGGGMRVEYAAGAAEPQVYQVAGGRADRLSPPFQPEFLLDWEDYVFQEEDARFFAALPEADTPRSSWKGYAEATVLALAAMALAAFPRAFFYLRHMWTVETPEPTRLFWLAHYFGLGLLVFLTLAGYLLALDGSGL